MEKYGYGTWAGFVKVLLWGMGGVWKVLVSKQQDSLESRVIQGDVITSMKL